MVAPEIVRRAERLAGAPNEEFVLATDGRLRWRGEIVGEIAEGDALLRPRVLILADDSLTGPALESVQERLGLWLRHAVNTQLEPIVALAEPADLEGTARGLAFRLSENLGILPRAAVSDEVKGLNQDVRATLRKHGIKFGAHHIYLPATLKPAPRELAIILWALKHGGVRQPGVSDLPHRVLSGRTSFDIDPAIDPRLYEIAGFKVAGKRAVRVDILERLADIIRPLIALDASTHAGELPPGAAEGNGFRVTVEMTSLLGCAGDEFASILTGLGYRLRRTPKPTAPAAAETAPEETGGDPAASGPADAAAAAGEASPDDATSAGATENAAPDAGGVDAAAPEERVPDADAPDGGSPDERAQDEGVPQPDAVGVVAAAQTPELLDAAPAGADQTADDATRDGAGEASAAAAETQLHAAGPAAEALAAAEQSEVMPAAVVEQVATAGDDDAAAPVSPPTAQFDEVWFPGGRRQQERRQHAGPRRSQRAADGANAEARPHRPSERHRGRPTRPVGTEDASAVPSDASAPPAADTGSGGKPRFERQRGPKRGKFGDRPARDVGSDSGRDSTFERPQRPQRPHREPAFDPDSPFAALAALRDRKPE